MCLSLNGTTGNWDRYGVTTLGFDEKTNTTSCNSSHLTCFAVLIRTRVVKETDIEKIIGSVFSYFFLCLSFIALIITLILYIVAGMEFIKVEMNILYLNYIIAMLMAIGCFIVGTKSVVEVKVLCTMVGMFLHYSWLSVFSWSLCNGILILYRLSIGKYRISSNNRTPRVVNKSLLSLSRINVFIEYLPHFENNQL